MEDLPGSSLRTIVVCKTLKILRRGAQKHKRFYGEQWTETIVAVVGCQKRWSNLDNQVCLLNAEMLVLIDERGFVSTFLAHIVVALW